ncbi:MAG: hypothetical protein PHU63_02050 [Candidatus ainarchaeum sp.]|nr:hypothetical protein [Candidatus ainarchaeum sp.]
MGTTSKTKTDSGSNARRKVKPKKKITGKHGGQDKPSKRLEEVRGVPERIDTGTVVEIPATFEASQTEVRPVVAEPLVVSGEEPVVAEATKVPIVLMNDSGNYVIRGLNFDPSNIFGERSSAQDFLGAPGSEIVVRLLGQNGALQLIDSAVEIVVTNLVSAKKSSEALRELGERFERQKAELEGIIRELEDKLVKLYSGESVPEKSLLENQLKAARVLLGKLEAGLEMASRKAEDAKSNAKDAETNATEERAQKGMFEEAKKEREQEIGKLEEERAKKVEDLQSVEEELGSLLAKVAELERRINLSIDPDLDGWFIEGEQNESVDDALRVLSDDNATTEEKHQAEVVMRSLRTIRGLELEQEKGRLSEELEHTKELIREAENRREDLIREIGDIDAKLDAPTRERDFAVEELRKIDEKANELDRKARGYRAEQKEWEAKRDEIRESITSMEEQIFRLEEKLVNLPDELQRRLNEEVTTRGRELEATKVQVEQEKERLDQEMRTRIEQLRDQILSGVAQAIKNVLEQNLGKR